jgi:arsenate reductase
MRPRILVLCTHNSARSQMAEGFLRALAGDGIEVESAGTEARGVNPLAVRAMAEVGIDLSGHRSKTLDRFLGDRWDYVITVCDSADESCPVFPCAGKRLHWSFDDPSSVSGTEEQRLEIAARSQMAEALFRAMAGERFEVASAGTAPTRLHPLAVDVMAEIGIDLSGHRAKSVYEAGHAWDYVITVCDAVFERCPEYPAKTCRLHWTLPDPAAAGPTDFERRAGFRRTRDNLRRRITTWLADRAER